VAACWATKLATAVWSSADSTNMTLVPRSIGSLPLMVPGALDEEEQPAKTKTHVTAAALTHAMTDDCVATIPAIM